MQHPPQKEASPRDSLPVRIKIVTAEDGLAPFLQLLQQGFTVEAQTGCSVDAFLTGQLGLAPDYAKNRIQTIFLNGKPVDDITTARVEAGATLSLSAAMPGLVGALLRKGGVLKSMRESISYTCTAPSAPEDCQPVKVKFFNLIARELGPAFLAHGIRVKGEDFADLISSPSDRFWSSIQSISVDANAAEAAELKALDWTGRAVDLIVETA
jgi:hypothetical protein